MAKSKKTKKKLEIDWSDEDSVKAAMARELEVDVDDVEISEDRGLSGFGEGTFYLVTIGHGSQEYQVAESDDAAEKLAVAVVTQDLESEPEIFEQSFIESHIDLDRLRRDLHSDTWDSNYERLRDEAERRPMEFFKDNNIDIPEPTAKQLREYADAMSDEENSVESILAKLEQGDAEDKWIEMGEDPEVPDSEIEKVAEDETEATLKDPVQYLRDIFGDEDGVKKAIEIGGIDIAAAAEEAVNTDGAGHFLARYDGYMHDGPGGIVWWRSN